MKEKYGFIYIWRDKGKNRWYLGAHWGDVNDNYICSSTWMRNSHRRRPWDFKRRILQKVLSKENLLIEEERWLLQIKQEELGKKYYNLRRQRYNIQERELSKNPMFKRKHTEEVKQKIGQASRERIVKDSTREKLSQINLGKHHSEETKRKQSEIRIGVARADKITWGDKISKAKKGVPSWKKGKTFVSEEEKRRKKNECNRKYRQKIKERQNATGTNC